MDQIQINTVSAVDAVCNALEEDILSLRFAPGEKITENILSVRYGVSRNTIREAVAHLLSQGLLTKVANKGVYVQRFTVEDVQEIFHLRALLETEAVSAIISAKSKPLHLNNIVEELERTSCETDWADYVRADIRFHASLVAAAESPRLEKLYSTIITEVKLCIFQTRNYVSIQADSNTTHRQILDAILREDAKTAVALLRQHIEHVIKRYCAGLLAMDKTN